MKKINLYIASLLLSVLAVSCSVDDVKPQGTLDEETAFSSPEKLVTAAYAKLGDDWYSYPFNLWPYGDMSADDCLKGGLAKTIRVITPWRFSPRCNPIAVSSTNSGISSIAPFPVATVLWNQWQMPKIPLPLSS